MVKRLLLWLTGLACLSACAAVPKSRSASAQGDGAQVAIVGVTVIPMTGGGATLADHTVLIRDGRIAALGPRRSLSIPAGAQVIEGKGRYLMPGLTDAHVHLEYVEDPNILKLFLVNGVTTVRSMDGRPFIRDWRERVKSGGLIGPRIVTAGPIIDGSPPAREDNLAVAEAASARAAVVEQKREGYDFIKAYSNLSAESYEAIVAEAKFQGLQVAGHVPKVVKLERAISSLSSLEHLGDLAGAVAVQGGSATPGWARRSLAAPLDQVRLRALAQQLAASGVWVVPTAVQQDRWLAPAAQVESWLADPQMRNLPPQSADQWKGSVRWSSRMDADDWKLLEQARKNRLAVISAFREAGVRLLIGSDTPNPFVIPGASVHLELANFVAAGFTPAEALAAATIETARMLGLENEQGSIQVGRRADLLLLSANPLTDVGNAQARVGLVLGGRWIAERYLQSMARDLVSPGPGTSR
jgi:hypothetical protein